MACVLIPAAEAVITTVVTEIVKAKAKKKGENPENVSLHKPFYKKMQWLNSMLWGGSALLVFEHVWHGEIVPWFPFLTAASNPQDTAAMLREMGTVGVAMAVVVTAAWACMVAVSAVMEKKARKAEDNK